MTLAFNVSMLTTAGTIANTGPPPVCAMKIVTRTGDTVSSATVGENLTLQVDVQPSSKFYFRLIDAKMLVQVESADASRLLAPNVRFVPTSTRI